MVKDRVEDDEDNKDNEVKENNNEKSSLVSKASIFQVYY